MLQKFKNPLIDNSQNYKLSSYIKTLLLDENYNEFYTIILEKVEVFDNAE